MLAIDKFCSSVNRTSKSHSEANMDKDQTLFLDDDDSISI